MYGALDDDVVVMWEFILDKNTLDIPSQICVSLKLKRSGWFPANLLNYNY